LAIRLPDADVMQRASRGQAGAEFAMVIAFLFALGVMGVQFFDLGLTAAKVSHAAQEAAFVAGSSVEAASDKAPCWAVTGGLARSQNYADAAVCQTVLENLGNVDPKLVAVSVSPSSLAQRGTNIAIHVSVTYRQPITSPLLRAFMGETFVTTSDAWSQ
jgi:Flp pilus assembly protein TadG